MLRGGGGLFHAVGTIGARPWIYLTLKDSGVKVLVLNG
jgi:hypothetical protein